MLGNYVNFGVFEMYNDSAFLSVLDVVLQLSMLISVSDMMAYPKVTKAFVGFVEVLTANHSAVVAQLDSGKLMHILNCLEEGIQNLDSGISSQCAAALDAFAVFYLNNAAPDTVIGVALLGHVRANPDMFRKLLLTVFNFVIFEDCQTLYSLSRPLFSLLLVHAAELDNLVSVITAVEPPERQQIVSLAFQKLVKDVELKHSNRNRDKFTQNLSQFKHEMKNLK